MPNLRNITIRYEDWIKYADAVGDFNPLHRDDEFAKKHGLEGKIAPGMFVASFIQTLREELIRKVNLKFRSPVKDGDVVEVSERAGRYSFVCKGKTVCEASVGFGDYETPEISPHGKIVHEYETNLTSERIRDFSGSICLANLGRPPEMFLAALSAPALLDYAGVQGKTGLHASQSFEIYCSYELGRIVIGIEEGRTKSGVESVQLYWNQHGKVIASGRALVVPVSLSQS